jgi:DNA/RNA endonuclease YhcR with UshA esterase domain
MLGNVLPSPPTPISIEEPKMENSISVWPNPFTDITVLEYSLSENNNAQIEIIDLNGKVIKTIRINDNSGKVELNLSQQAEGVYQYRFINGNEEIENGKLVLVK